MGKLRRNSHPSGAAAEDSKPPRSFFLGCFGLSGEAKPIEKQKSSKDRSPRRRKMSDSCLFCSTDTSAVAVPRTGSDPFGLVHPISAGQDAAPLESAQFRKEWLTINTQYQDKTDIIIEDHDQLEMVDDVASKEEDFDKFQNPLSVTSSNRNDPADLTPPAKATRRFSRSRSLPAPAKKKMKAAFTNINPTAKENRKSYGAGLLIAAVTLVVMVVWGRVCAIICVSGFLYAFPLLRDSGEAERSDSKSNDVVDDDDYQRIMKTRTRRQVVLDGFLQRSRRSPAEGRNGISVNLL